MALRRLCRGYCESRERLPINAESPESIRFDGIAAKQFVGLVFVEAGFRCDAGRHFLGVWEGAVGVGRESTSKQSESMPMGSWFLSPVASSKMQLQTCHAPGSKSRAGGAGRYRKLYA